MSNARQSRIDQILARIDSDADAGFCSNWAETDETPTALIVTFADGSTRRYNLPRA